MPGPLADGVCPVSSVAGDGTWDRLLAQVQPESDSVGEVRIDRTVIRAHKQAAGAPNIGRFGCDFRGARAQPG